MDFLFAIKAVFFKSLYYFECNTGNEVIVIPVDVLRVYVNDVEDL